ncbi:MAG: 50S ribosomal protein L25/general stress protein Ctc, partial [Proteobacteria bacterium]|nr:50S ribosomal protein L25/general stress protein Ctc [Pseudomonadota bacterium]
MTNIKQLSAKRREKAGKGAARALRRDGQIPAVVYGAGQAPVSIAIDYTQANRLIYAGHFLTTIFEIDVDGQKLRAIPRDYQLDPVRDTPVHIDFLRLGVGSRIAVEVPVHFINHETSPGLKRGGVLNIVRHSVGLSVLAEAIPDSLTADLAGLDLNDSVHISAIKLPEGARPTITDRDFTIATIAVPAG